MPKLPSNKQLIEMKLGKEIVIKTGLKNKITKFPGDVFLKTKGFATIETASTRVIDGKSVPRTTFVDLEIADLIVNYHITIGYDNTKDNEDDEYTKGYFIARYNGNKEKLHRFIYKYLHEKMSVEDIFNGKPSICDDKEVHHISGLTYDNLYENLLLCETVQEHNEYQSNVSSWICLNKDTNEYTIKSQFMEIIWCLKQLKRELKGELPKSNKDYQTFYNELKDYAKMNEKVLFQENELDIHFRE